MTLTRWAFALVSVIAISKESHAATVVPAVAVVARVSEHKPVAAASGSLAEDVYAFIALAGVLALAGRGRHRRNGAEVLVS